MRRDRAPTLAAAVLALGLAGGCETVPSTEYDAFIEHMPRSILVLPPLNESIEADAPYSWVTTVSRPLAERGYYVFPVAMVDEFMKENGLPGPEEMHAVSLAKLDEVFDPDAVLYVTIEEFGQKFELLSSVTRVEARGALVDTDTGIELWQGTVRHAESSGSSGQGGLADLIGAAVAQAAGTVSDKPHQAAAAANRTLLTGPRGFLYGPRHPEFGTDHPEVLPEDGGAAMEGAPEVEEEPEAGTGGASGAGAGAEIADARTSSP